jgi:hypothetical protein
MESTARRAAQMLRQHPLLLSAPWLVVSAAGFIVTRIVQQILNRLYPLVSLHTMSAAGYAAQDAAASNNMIASFIRMVAIDSILILESAFEVIALALMVLMVKQLATQGSDTFFAALERLRKIPSVAGILLKFFAIVLLLDFATTLVAELPVILYVPLTMSMHMMPHFLPRWVMVLSADLGTLLFVLCVMPVFLKLVFRLQRPSASGQETHAGLLPRAMIYGALVIVVQVALGLLMRPMQKPLGITPAIGALMGHSLIGLVTNLVASLPTIECIVAIALMVMDAAEPVSDGELA